MRFEPLGTAGFHPSEERHTSGVFLPDAAPDHAFLLDAGSGTFRLVGRELPSNLHVFLTHAHLDHVCGLSFLLNISLRRAINIEIYGDARTLETVRDHLFAPAIFPLGLPFPLHEIAPGASFEVAGAQINTFALTHPGGALAYRFDWPQKSLALVSDSAGDGRYFGFIEGADALIHERNFPDSKAHLADSSGHCTSSALVEAARASGAKIVVATHFDPLTPGDPLEEDDVYARLPGVISARDGMTIEF
jgi:ribonuclease Z